MNSKFSVCFGIALIITGMFNFIFETSNVILLGMNFSALLFSLINFIILIFYKHIKSDKVEFFYIIPFVVLLVFCCFNESFKSITFINNLADSKILNAISFLSFGLIFISEFFSYKKELDISRNMYYQMIISKSEHSKMIFSKILEYKNKTTDEASIEFFSSMEKMLSEEIKRIKIDSKLIKSKKHFFSIVDFDEAYTESNEK